MKHKLSVLLTLGWIYILDKVGIDSLLNITILKDLHNYPHLISHKTGDDRFRWLTDQYHQVLTNLSGFECELFDIEKDV